jgi:hypothetical protein
VDTEEHREHGSRAAIPRATLVGISSADRNYIFR